jgi:hypothetical protein
MLHFATTYKNPWWLIGWLAILDVLSYWGVHPSAFNYAILLTPLLWVDLANLSWQIKAKLMEGGASN